MYYTYILKSKIKNWLYTGFTTDLKNRFTKHNLGLVISTKNYRPLELIFYEAYKSRSDAKRRENFLKTNQGKRTLKLMLKESLK
jgi:putative endonuclease